MRRIVIMGAAGRDFHNFNTVYRHDPDAEVVAFTAAQIPFISDRVYPPALAGSRYPDGIRIHDEAELPELIRKLEVDDVVFSLLGRVARVRDAPGERGARRGRELPAPRAGGDHARGPGPRRGRLRGSHGCRQEPDDAARGADPPRRRLHPVVVRHPMPYGDLVAERVQRFVVDSRISTPRGSRSRNARSTSTTSRTAPSCTPGWTTGAILECAEMEADVVLWDGGNNDLPFFRPTIHDRRRRPVAGGRRELVSTRARPTCGWPTSS